MGLTGVMLRFSENDLPKDPVEISSNMDHYSTDATMSPYADSLEQGITHSEILVGILN